MLYVVKNKDIIECVCLGTMGMIVAPWKFDVFKTGIFALEALLLWQIYFFNNIKFQQSTLITWYNLAQALSVDRMP